MGATAHERTRKSLSGQLDRLDHILDGFGGGLNEVVSLAVERTAGEAVRRAVADVLAEMVTNPALPPALPTPLMPAPTDPRPGLLGNVVARLQAWLDLLLEKARAAWRLAVQNKGRVLAVACAGTAVAAGYVAGPALVPLGAWLIAWLLTQASRLGLVLRNSLASVIA